MVWTGEMVSNASQNHLINPVFDEIFILSQEEVVGSSKSSWLWYTENQLGMYVWSFKNQILHSNTHICMCLQEA